MAQKHPKIILLFETLCKKDQVERVQKALSFEGMINVDCQGQGGGLALLWKNKTEVTIDSYRMNHIDVKINIQGWSWFRLTGL